MAIYLGRQVFEADLSIISQTENRYPEHPKSRRNFLYHLPQPACIVREGQTSTRANAKWTMVDFSAAPFAGDQHVKSQFL